jgi:heparosan-N-sulfate-glucuronate 5-epimerase
MSLSTRLQYYSRIFVAYAMPIRSHLTFWHEKPEINARAGIHELGEYYMSFAEKADYNGDYDGSGIPLLNYRGSIGRQYNPIAIAQWGLGNYNLFCRSQEARRKRKFLAASDWLCAHLEQNSNGVSVWNHHFDWEYRSRLRAPWYSALAQGQGISLLVRAYCDTGSAKYLKAAERAFASFCLPTHEGGVTFTDDLGNIWFEEYIVAPPTHILNGFIWALWGVYDFLLATRSAQSKDRFDKAVHTLKTNLHRYDLGFWSLYEHSGTTLPMIASRFYHSLHIAQLRIMHRLTQDPSFASFADKWESYGRSRSNRTRALCWKTAFKLCYY